MAVEESYIPTGSPGPRMVGGVLKWCAGDTFELRVTLELTDENGAPITTAEPCTVEFKFRNERKESVWTVTFGDIKDDRVVLWFDEEVTKSFSKGRYSYDVIYNGAVRRTLAKDAPILVE